MEILHSMFMLTHKNKQAYQLISLLFFLFGFEYQRNEDAEEHGSADTGCRGGEAAGEYAEKPVIFDCLLNALGKRVSEARQRNGRTGTRPVNERLIKPYRTEDDTGDDIRRQYPCGRELGFVDQNLTDSA